MRYVVLAICFAVACLTVQPAQAQVHVNIGSNLPAPPQWVVVPGFPVYYAPDAPANVFPRAMSVLSSREPSDAGPVGRSDRLAIPG